MQIQRGLVTCMRILLAEQDERLGKRTSVWLQRVGFRVGWVRDGIEAEDAAQSGIFDVVVLNIQLPHKDGLAVLKSMRQKKNDTPVLMLTTSHSVVERVNSLDAGADRLIAKPVDLDELTALLRSLVRRYRRQLANVLQCGAVSLDLTTRNVSKSGVPVTLTTREYEALQALMQRAGRVITREELELHVCAWGQIPGSNLIQVHIHNLRRKLGKAFIRTVRGVGYTLQCEPNADFSESNHK